MKNNKVICGVEFYSSDPTILIANIRPMDLFHISNNCIFSGSINGGNSVITKKIKQFSDRVLISRNHKNKYEYIAQLA